jgi:hypothetical protein
MNPRGTSDPATRTGVRSRKFAAPAREAKGACSPTPWSSAVLQAPPFDTMCDGLDRLGGYLICRMVQVLSVDILNQTKPEGVVE